MKLRPICSLVPLSVLILLAWPSIRPVAQDMPILTPEQRSKMLSERTPGSMIGTFGSFASALYAMQDVAIHTNSETVSRTELVSPFPEFYKPTWREFFDSLARITGSTWNYDATSGFWVFTEPAMPLPFKIKVAENWTTEVHGDFIAYIPPTAPVGLDIYILGTYSAETDEQTVFDKVRVDIALRFSDNFKENITADDMTKVKINDYEALHLERLVRKSGIMWRQWIIVHSGLALAVVSAIKPEDEPVILPDVKAMIHSLKIEGGNPAR